MRIVYRSMAITLAALSLSGRALAAPVETVLYSFCSLPKCTDGAGPKYGRLLAKDGALYATTEYGGGGLDGLGGVCDVNSGSGACGTVFKLTPPGNGQTRWTERVLHSFTGSDGGIPYFGLIAKNKNEGVLYGTTVAGGTGNGGTVFKLTPPAEGLKTWIETVLYGGNTPWGV